MNCLIYMNMKRFAKKEKQVEALTVNCGVQVDFLYSKIFFSKLGIDLYGSAKIQTFTAQYTTSGTVLLTINIHILPQLQQTVTNISNLSKILNKLM